MPAFGKPLAQVLPAELTESASAVGDRSSSSGQVELRKQDNSASGSGQNGGKRAPPREVYLAAENAVGVRISLVIEFTKGPFSSLFRRASIHSGSL